MDVTDLVGKYDALATQLAPDVLQKVLEATTLGGIGDLILGGVFFFLWAITVIVGYKINPTFDADHDNLPWQALLFILGTIFLFIPAVFMLADIWNWVAIWRPDLAVTHQIINNLGSSK